MNLVEELVKEHQRIKQQLEPFKQSCMLVNGGDPQDLIIQFKQLAKQLKELIVLKHISKEEELLFPELEKIGVSVDHGPIGLLLREHRFIKEFIRNLQEFSIKIGEGNLLLIDLFCHQLTELVWLIEHHLEKEENGLFEIAKLHLKNKEL